MTSLLKFFTTWLAVAVMAAHAQTALPASPEPRIIRGNDQVLAPANTKGQVTGAPAAFKFEEAPLSEVVGLILRDIVKVDYVIHPPINGTVTLATQGEVPPDQAIFLLEAALQANGLLMARDARGTYHMGRRMAAISPAPMYLSGTTMAP